MKHILCGIHKSKLYASGDISKNFLFSPNEYVLLDNELFSLFLVNNQQLLMPII